MAALEGQHKYHRVFLHLTGHSNLKQTYRVNDECQMKLFQAVGEKHSVRILFALFLFLASNINYFPFSFRWRSYSTSAARASCVNELFFHQATREATVVIPTLTNCSS